MRKEIKVECRECGGTGLYRGFAEREGTAVVCLRCNGTGCRKIMFEVGEIIYTPYLGRKKRQDVHFVYESQGTLVFAGVGAKRGTEMTYSEFERRFPEEPI